MPHPKSQPARSAAQIAVSDALNEEFQELLRDGAQAREDRARAAAEQDRLAAAQESKDLIALARRPGNNASVIPPDPGRPDGGGGDLQ